MFVTRKSNAVTRCSQNPATYANSGAEEILKELSKKPQHRPRQGGLTSPWAPSPQEVRTPGGPTMKRRLEMLSCYGCPSDSSPNVVLNDSSSRVKKDFTPVTRGKSRGEAVERVRRKSPTTVGEKVRIIGH
jgi:hypothetical protein